MTSNFSALLQTRQVCDRFWQKAARDEGCWEWQGTKDARGYGRFGLNTTTHRADGVVVIQPRGYLAHRVAWQLTHGDIPAGLGVLHRCNHPSCVNPAHLYVGDQLANNRQAVRDRRNATKLRREDVGRIRNLWSAGVAQRQLATVFAVSRSTISMIVRGLRWGYEGQAAVRWL